MSNKDTKLNKTTDSQINSLAKLTLEGNTMSLDHKSEVKPEITKEELSFAQKKEMRRNAIDKKSRLFLDEKFKEKGYTYRICNVTPGNIESYLDKGYEIVEHKLDSGSGNIARPEVNGIPGEFEVGGATGKQKAIWMRINAENKEILDSINQDFANEQLESLYQGKDKQGNQFIPNGHQYGKITKDF